MHWWTDAPEYAVEFFTFGFDHPWTSEDVGWEETARRDGPEYYTFCEDWGYMVGIWCGPVHGPYGPYGDLNHDLCVDQRACPGTRRARPAKALDVRAAGLLAW